MLVEWGQLKATSGLVLEYAGRKASKTTTSATALAPAEAEPFDPSELEAALDEVSRSVRLALLA